MPPKGNKRRRTGRGNTVVTTTTTTSTITSDEKNSNNKRTNVEKTPDAAAASGGADDLSELQDPYNGALPMKLLIQLNRLKKPFYNDFIQKNKDLFKTTTNVDDTDKKESISTKEQEKEEEEEKEEKDIETNLQKENINKSVLELNQLINTWEYQYVVSFMYCTFPSFFNKNRDKKGFFGKKPIPQPPRLLRDLIASHQNNNSFAGSSFKTGGIRVSVRQQQLNLQKERELSEKLESIDFDGKVEYGPDQRKFHEFLFLQDVLKYIENGYKFDDDIIAFPEYKGDTFAWLLMELAIMYNQSKSFCDEQGCLLKHDTWFSDSWNNGNIVDKFKILFSVLKLYEIRHMGLNNYIKDNMDLFYFPKFDVEIEKTTKTQSVSKSSRSKKNTTTTNGDSNNSQKKKKEEEQEKETILSKIETQEQFMLLHGGKIVKIVRNVESPLNLPLRETHAYDSEGKELVKFEEKIKQYTESIKFDYETVAFDFDTLMHFNTNITEFYENNLEVEKNDDLKEYSANEDNAEIDEDYTLRQVYMNTKYGLNLFNSRMRQRESEAFFNNKKTSKIFVDKISEKNKKSIEEETKEKSQKQIEYLHKSNYLRNKAQRIIRDQVTAQLWNKYHTLQLSSDEMKEQEFFKDIAVEKLRNLKFESHFRNFPYSLIWKDEDLQKLEINDLYFPSAKDIYDMNWMFNCSCDSTAYTGVKSPNNETAKEVYVSKFLEDIDNLTVIKDDSDLEALHSNNIKGDIISCVRCNRWSHFKCFDALLKKDPLFATIVASFNQTDEETLKSLEPASFDIVSMGGVEEEKEEDIKIESNENEDSVNIEEEEVDENKEKSLSKEETESSIMPGTLEANLIEPETNGRSSRRAAASKHVDYTGKTAYQAVEEEEKESNSFSSRRSSRRKVEQKSYDEEKDEEEEELVKDGRPSFLSQFPMGPLEPLLKSTHPLTKLLFRGLAGKTAESQEDLEVIYDTLYQRFYKMICYQCCKNVSDHVIKEQFPELLKQELVRQAKNEIAKQKRLARKQKKLEEKEKEKESLNGVDVLVNSQPTEEVVETKQETLHEEKDNISI
ncbi:hypothetical protein HANVADRAFT_53913 [Hanseniaspora valbyensis NRRL Y-1626]|uniref:Uncharacterized protein n=1 Tax=Hanseniaspora valbyensis NRRL Y-1626 TaxID=766949 RepID=A0A1B7T9N8_9ASCO|nr:hypothetical protein HANVADRAFT_53913 [Hanseniaspora valbyensis NRRL Y-1626]